MQRQSAQNRLRELRHQRRECRMVDVAAAAGKDQSLISRYERGLTEIPDEVKERLARFFGVTRAHLMGWDEDEVDLTESEIGAA